MLKKFHCSRGEKSWGWRWGREVEWWLLKWNLSFIFDQLVYKFYITHTHTLLHFWSLYHIYMYVFVYLYFSYGAEILAALQRAFARYRALMLLNVYMVGVVVLVVVCLVGVCVCVCVEVYHNIIVGQVGSGLGRPRATFNHLPSTHTHTDERTWRANREQGTIRA